MLAAARPTPFRDRTVLEYALSRGGAVELAIYSVDGRKVRTLERGERSAGVYRAGWDGRDDQGAALAAGMYYARLVTVDGRFSRTLIRVR
jgi:flagellar hook assembly protein FlgD